MYIIIVRYQENISWVSSLNKDCQIYIYNKGNSITNNLTGFKNCSIYNVENIGRESEGYLRFIIENYDNIKDEEQYVFTQADPFAHCVDFPHKIEKLKTLDYGCTLLGDYIVVNTRLHNTNSENVSLLKHYYFNNQLVVKSWQKQNFVKCNFIRDNNFKYKWSTDSTFITQTLERENFFKKTFNKPIPIFNWSEGALFAIKGKYIKNRPKEFYIRLK
jgi:hypothetical protein